MTPFVRLAFHLWLVRFGPCLIQRNDTANGAPSGYEQRRIVAISAFPSNHAGPIMMQFFSCPGVPSECEAQLYTLIPSLGPAHESYGVDHCSVTR